SNSDVEPTVANDMPYRSSSPLLRFLLHPARLADHIDLDATDTSGAAEPRRHRARRDGHVEITSRIRGGHREQNGCELGTDGSVDLGVSTGAGGHPSTERYGNGLVRKVNVGARPAARAAAPTPGPPAHPGSPRGHPARGRDHLHPPRLP